MTNSYKIVLFLVGFREEEGIELQVLSNKPTTSTVEPVYGNIPLSMMFGEAAALPSTDADSVDSGEYEEIGTEKPSSTIGALIKTDVCFHLKPPFFCRSQSRSAQKKLIREQ